MTTKSMNHIAGLPSCALRYIAQDTQGAFDAMPDGPNAGYYTDEILYCIEELQKRANRRVNREGHYEETLTKIWVILKEAGYCGEDMIDDLRDLVNDSRRPATEEAEGVDYKAKYDELIEAILLWAKTPQNHGGNPYGHDFMKLVPW